jgi:hypothetical protein
MACLIAASQEPLPIADVSSTGSMILKAVWRRTHELRVSSSVFLREALSCEAARVVRNRSTLNYHP